MLFTSQEIQAILALFNRTPMSPAEQLFAQGFFQRLVAFCQPPKPEPNDIKPGPNPGPEPEAEDEDEK